MASGHPEPQILERFVRGRATEAESRQIVLHLISGCPRCLRLTRAAWGRLPPVTGLAASGMALHPSSYAGLWERLSRFERLCRQGVEADQRQAPLLLAQLRGLAAGERLARVAQDERFRSFALGRLLIAESRRHPPAAGRGWAEMAIAVAAGLKGDDPAAAGARDLEASAWAALAALRCHLGDLDGAGRALATAETLLEKGSGDPLERAELFLGRAALTRLRGHLDEARAWVRRARLTHRGLGLEHFHGRTLVEEARIRAGEGDLRGSARLLEEARRRLDARRHPRLAFEAASELAHALFAGGRIGEAERALQSARALGRLQEGRRQPDRRLVRLEGRIALARGRLDEAEGALREASFSLAAAGLVRDAALATLDLAALYVLESRHGELRRLAREVAVVLVTCDPGVDVRTALLLFRLAADSGRVTDGLVAQLAAHVRRAHRAQA